MIYTMKVSNRTGEISALLKIMESRGLRTDWDTVSALETGAIIFQHEDDRVAPLIAVNRIGYEFMTEEEYLDLD